MNFLTRSEQENGSGGSGPYAICSGTPAGVLPRGRARIPDMFSTGPGPHRPLRGVPAARVQNPSVSGRLGDHYRTRLTHTLEVAQIARTLARALRVNEELCRRGAGARPGAPFGHAGNDPQPLDAGREIFEHNAQALRIVDRLEYRYPDFRD